MIAEPHSWISHKRFQACLSLHWIFRKSEGPGTQCRRYSERSLSSCSHLLLMLLTLQMRRQSLSPKLLLNDQNVMRANQQMRKTPTPKTTAVQVRGSCTASSDSIGFLIVRLSMRELCYAHGKASRAAKAHTSSHLSFHDASNLSLGS